MVHHPRRPGLLVSRGGKWTEGVSIPPLSGRQVRYFLYLSLNLVGRGFWYLGGEWKAGEGGGGVEGECTCVGSNSGGGLFSPGPDLQDDTHRDRPNLWPRVKRLIY